MKEAGHARSQAQDLIDPTIADQELLDAQVKLAVNRFAQWDGPGILSSIQGRSLMETSRPTLVQEIAEAVVAFQEKATGHAPKAVTVVLSQDTLVIVLHAALSPAEKDLARSPKGATQVREFHRQLFSTASRDLQDDMKRITGVEWTEAVAEVEPTTGGMVQAFARAAAIQVLHLATDGIGQGPRGHEDET